MSVEQHATNYSIDITEQDPDQPCLRPGIPPDVCVDDGECWKWRPPADATISQRMLDAGGSVMVLLLLPLSILYDTAVIQWPTFVTLLGILFGLCVVAALFELIYAVCKARKEAAGERRPEKDGQ